MNDGERDEAETAQEAALAELVANSFDELWGKVEFLTISAPIGEGKTEAAQLLLGGHHDLFAFPDLLQPQGRTHRAIWAKETSRKRYHTAAGSAERRTHNAVQATESARKRYRTAAGSLKAATTLAERRTAARTFLAALAELVACLLGFLVSVLLLLLSRLLGCVTADDLRVWKPAPIETTPQIVPRGPNPAFPVNTNRGGHGSSSAQGSVALAA